MEALQVLLAIAFSLLGVVCLILGLLGLPGNWILLALALGMHFLSTGSIGWGFLGAALVIAIAGEALETWASVAGLSAGGGSRRGMWGAIIGGLVGGVLLTGLLPIPIVGTLVGAAAGAFLGALVGELTGPDGRAPGASLKAATGAAVGRVAGSLGKTILGVIIWTLLTVQVLSNLWA